MPISKTTLAGARVPTPLRRLLIDIDESGGTTNVLSSAGAPAPTSFATPAIVLGSTATAGIAATVIRSDATIKAFDTTAPVTQAYGDVAAAGVINFAARRDHKHGMPAATTAHTHDGAGATSTLVGGVAEAGTGLPVASGTSAMAIGDFASSTGTHSIVIGGGGEAQGTGHTSAAKSTGDRCVVIGPNASSVVAEAVVIGRSANATTGDQGVAIGRDAAVRADGVAVGVGSSATATSVVAVGGSASGTVQFACSFGNSALASADSALAMGAAAAASGAMSVAVGGSRFTSGHAVANASGAIAVGANSSNNAGPTASGANALAMVGGDGTTGSASASGAFAIAIGGGSSATQSAGIAIGKNAANTNSNAVAIGVSASTSKANQIKLGTNTEVVTLPGAIEIQVVAKSGTYTALATDTYVHCDATSAAFTVTLPASASGNKGHILIFKKIDTSANAVTISRAGSDSIDGATTKALAAQYDVLMILDRGNGNWDILKFGAP